MLVVTVSLTTIIIAAAFALILLGWLFTWLKLRFITVVKRKEEDADFDAPRTTKFSRYKDAFASGCEEALRAIPSIAVFLAKCTAYAVVAVTALTVAGITIVLYLSAL
jgi:hypothetical protein